MRNVTCVGFELLLTTIILGGGFAIVAPAIGATTETQEYIGESRLQSNQQPILAEETGDPSASADGNNNCCTSPPNCGVGCSVCCPAKKEAHCDCLEQDVLCPPFTPYPGSCHKYTPVCRCR
ncbi:MAG: hypothetical protein V1723_00390 [Candidatus Uhrbacteria bacterium]